MTAAACMSPVCVISGTPSFQRVETSESAAKRLPSLWVSPKQAFVGVDAIAWYLASTQHGTPLLPPHLKHAVRSWLEWSSLTKSSEKLRVLDATLKNSSGFLADEQQYTLADLLVWSSLLEHTSQPAAVAAWGERLSGRCHATA